MGVGLEDLQRSFARRLRAEGRSDRTVVIYGQAVTLFSRWLEAQGREAAVDELTRAAIREWLAHLSDINEASTVKTRYRGLFRFCGWLVDEDEMPKNPMETLSSPQPKMKPVPIEAVVVACSFLWVAQHLIRFSDYAEQCAGPVWPVRVQSARKLQVGTLDDSRFGVRRYLK